MEKKNKIYFIISYFVAYALAITSIILDAKLKLNIDSLFGFAELLYPTVITVAGFLITLYILFLELYKDRVSLEDMEKKNFKINLYFHTILYNIIFGATVLCIKNGFISFILFFITSIITIIAILYKIFKSNKSLVLNSYLKKFCEDIESNLSISNAELSRDTIDNIKRVLDECVLKEEYHTVDVIVEKTGDIFRTFLKNSINISSEQNESVQDVTEIFDNIISLNFFELNLCKTIKSYELIKRIVDQQRKNICFCLDNFQSEWFKKYFDKCLLFLYKTQKINPPELVELIYASFSRIIVTMYKHEHIDYAKESLNKISELNNSFFYTDKRDNAKEYIKFLTGAVDFAIKEKNDDFLDFIIERIKELVLTITQHSDMVTNFVECYELISKMILEYDFEKAAYLYKKTHKYFSYNNISNPLLLECNMFILNGLFEKDEKEKSHQKEFIEYYIHLLYQISKSKEKYTGYLFFFDFQKMIKENQGVDSKIGEIAEYIERILNNCILGDNIPLFYEFLDKLDDTLIETKSNQKIEQEHLLSIYFWLIKRTYQLVNKQFIEITFFKLDKTLKNMDDKKLISVALGKYIINRLHYSSRQIQTNDKACLEIIDTLFSFLDKEEPYSFVLNKNEQKKLLYKTLFNIGTECIENGFEEGVRCVSNSLGWLAIYSIERDNNDLTEYLIQRISEFFKIAKSMKVSHKTKMFMLTLFPTVGAYYCKNMGTLGYCSQLIDAIVDESHNDVLTAVNLRTNENDMWNDLYDGQTDKLTNEFLLRYNKAVENKNMTHV